MAEFNPKEYLASKQAAGDAGDGLSSTGFDPKAYLASKEKKSAGLSDYAQTALESSGKALTLGYLPQLQAKAEPLTDRIYDRINRLIGNRETDVAPMSQLTENSPEYIKSRDDNIKRQKGQEEEMPYTAKAAGLAGGIVGGLALPAGKIATLGQALKTGAITGAAYGGLSNPGDTEGQTSGAQIDQRLLNAGVGGAAGGLLGGGLYGVGKGLGMIKDAPKLIDRFKGTVASNSQEIEDAANRLQITPTRGMLSKSPEVRNLESALEQQPTTSGAKVLGEKTQVWEGLKKAGEDVVKDKASLSRYEAGEAVKDGLVSRIQEKLMPLKMSYDDLASLTQNMPLNQRSTGKIAMGLRRNPLGEFPNTPTGKIINEFADNIEKSSSVESLRTLERNAQAGLRQAQNASDGASAVAYGKVIDTLKRAQQSHILRASVESAATKGQGTKIAKDIVSQLKDTNKGYRALAETIEEIAGTSGIKYKGPQSFLDALEEVPSEQIADKLYKTNNYKALQAIKQHVPDEFEILRRTKIEDLSQRSQTKGEISLPKIISNLKAMGPEAREITFGKGSNQMLKDLETVYNSLPTKVGPSGTPSGTKWMNLLKPSHWGDEAATALQYMIYKDPVGAVSSVGKFVAPLSSSAGPVQKGLVNSTQGLINRAATPKGYFERNQNGQVPKSEK